MHRVGSAGNTTNSVRPRKEKRLAYVLSDADDTKHCAGINCLKVLKSTVSNGYSASCSATYESHVDWVNDVVLAGDSTLVSCSSDTTLKTWNCLSDGTCTKTLRQHSDYVTCLAAAEKNSNIVASGGLGGEVFIWDMEAALTPVSNSSNSISVHTTQGYVPVGAKGHKESVYALAMNDSGTRLVSGGTEKVVRVWDPRTGSKAMKLRGHTDNIRALLLDSTGRYCLSGSSDSMIRLWDLGMQRCLHSYAVHTDSVWALASTPTFSHVYSGGRDLSLYLTDLATRESLLLCTKEHPISQLALHDDSIWVATTDSSVDRWPAEAHNPSKGSIPVPVYKEPTLTIPGTSALVQHEILNNRRHVLTKDTAGSVKLWEITRGIVIEDYGKVSFEEKKEQLFEMVSIPTWFTVDTRLGSLSVHLDTPQCFSAEMYSADLNIVGKAEDDKVNLAHETLKGLLAHWLAKRRQRLGSQASANVSPPSVVTEGYQGGPWRKKITDLDGSEDEKDFPWWCLDCVLNNRLPPKENSKCSFYLHPCEGSAFQILTQGKLSAPRILRIHKVVNYVAEKMVLDKPLDNVNTDGTFAPGLGGHVQHSVVGDGSFRSGAKPWQKLKPSIEILCNNQVLSPDMSLATFFRAGWLGACGDRNHVPV
ncbi:hypothetical protein OIU78_021151 [Salix suchowensis]|nr:hypothetical protein OIU78_021151 [Salix suchowensis]